MWAHLGILIQALKLMLACNVSLVDDPATVGWIKLYHSLLNIMRLLLANHKSRKFQGTVGLVLLRYLWYNVVRLQVGERLLRPLLSRNLRVSKILSHTDKLWNLSLSPLGLLLFILQHPLLSPA